MRIFVVEDEEPARKGLIHLIRSLAPQDTIVGQAADGREALKRIVRLKPDLVFSDIRIPWLDGLSLVTAVHAHDVHPEFVIVTAHADFAYAKSAISLGVCEYLVKPVMADELAAAIRSSAARVSARKAAAALPSSESASGQPPSHLSDDSLPPLPSAGSPVAVPSRRTAGTVPSKDSEQRRIADILPEISSDLHPAIRKALRIIESEYAGPIMQDALAQSVHVTPEYFSQLFHRCMSLSFSNYLRRYRIQMACRLLGERGVKIQQVAESVGYPDPKYFCRVFREVTGMTPTEYQSGLRGMSDGVPS